MRRSPRLLGALARADLALLELLRGRGHSRLADAAMKSAGRAGEYGAVWVAVGAAGALADRRRSGRWLAAGALGPASVGINFAVKVLVGRKRPVLDHPRLARAPSELSFPSAHATSSLAAAIALGRVEPRLRPALLALALPICASRPYLGMHYPSDVLAGVVLGAAIGASLPGLEGPETPAPA